MSSNDDGVTYRVEGLEESTQSRRPDTIIQWDRERMLRMVPQHGQQHEMKNAQECMKGVTPTAQSSDTWMVPLRFDRLSIDVLLKSG